MTLDQALRTLTEVHTKDDKDVGFTVLMGASPDFFRVDEYVEAWNVVRTHLGMQAPAEFVKVS